MQIHWKSGLVPGNIIVSVCTDHQLCHAVLSPGMYRIGDILEGEHGRIQITASILLPGDVMNRAFLCNYSGNGNSCTEVVRLLRKGFSLGWITLSDKGSRGERVDASGPMIRDTVAEHMELCFSSGLVIPDESQILKSTLVDFCLCYGFDMVFTTGGTGVGPRDITPETTLPLLDKRLEGFERMMTQASIAKTPHGMISRAVAGVMGHSLVVNLPGSPKAVRENLTAIMPAIKHAIEKIQGDMSDCGKPA